MKSYALQIRKIQKNAHSSTDNYHNINFKCFMNEIKQYCFCAVVRVRVVLCDLQKKRKMKLDIYISVFCISLNGNLNFATTFLIVV